MKGFRYSATVTKDCLCLCRPYCLLIWCCFGHMGAGTELLLPRLRPAAREGLRTMPAAPVPKWLIFKTSDGFSSFQQQDARGFVKQCLKSRVVRERRVTRSRVTGSDMSCNGNPEILVSVLKQQDCTVQEGASQVILILEAQYGYLQTHGLRPSLTCLCFCVVIILGLTFPIKLETEDPLALCRLQCRALVWLNDSCPQGPSAQTSQRRGPHTSPQWGNNL